MVKNKIIAYYLPQFHQIPENDKWWGEGFTEWVNVKKAQPLFEGHYQPRTPLNDNYYDLSKTETLKWQAKIAKEHGIYGFCFYHYWFYEKPLLEKPLYNFLHDKSIDINFCFCWANESWTNAWSSADRAIIMEQKYGDKEEWTRHFNFMLPFFFFFRYIKEGNEPLLVIYRPYLYENMIDMLDYWKQLAIENGFDGLKIASQRFEQPEKEKDLYEYLDYHIDYQPDYDKCHLSGKDTITSKIKGILKHMLLDHFNIDLHMYKKNRKPLIFSYDEMWQNIISSNPDSEKTIAGAFVDWDNTPRHGNRGSCFSGVSPEKFGEYLKMQLNHVAEKYSNDYLFMFAWNEWGEGGYLEPDNKYGYAYLEEIKKAIGGEV